MVRPVYVTGMVRYKPLLWHTSMYHGGTYYLPICHTHIMLPNIHTYIVRTPITRFLTYTYIMSHASLMSVLVHGQLKLPIHGRQKHPRTEGALARSAPSELRP